MTVIDPGSPLAAQIRATVTYNEIADETPYRLSFAGQGNSGGSFGRFQSDCAVNGRAKITLTTILAGAGLANADAIVEAVSRHCPENPLSAPDAAAVDAALASDAGRRLVDALDETIFSSLLANVATAIDASAVLGMKIDPDAASAIACWINMTGAPTVLSMWLKGIRVGFPGGSPLPPAGPSVTLDDMLRYLGCTSYESQHPRNLAHLEQAVAHGAVPVA